MFGHGDGGNAARQKKKKINSSCGMNALDTIELLEQSVDARSLSVRL